MLGEDERADNTLFTCTSLSAGCGIGVIFGIAILLAFSVTTYDPTLVTSLSWQGTTELTWNSTNSTEPHEVYTNRYAPYGIVALTVGVLACPTILLGITVARRLKDNDLLHSDYLGIGIVALGFLCGVAVGVGSFFAFGWDVRGSSDFGLFLFIVVPFMIVVTVLLLLCYRHHKDDSYSLYGGLF